MLPELFLTLKGYTRRQALSDVGAGVIVGIVALPLAIAFARTATNSRNGGRTPVAGIVHALTLLLIALTAEAIARARAHLGFTPADGPS